MISIWLWLTVVFANIAAAFAEVGDVAGLLRLVLPCAFYEEAVYRLAASLPRVFPEQASDIVEVLTHA